MKMSRRLYILIMALLPLTASAQFNVDRLILSGRIALSYEDYVLAIQHFNRAILSKPYLYEPWYYRGIAKFYLDDFVGAESDCTEAIRLNPYVTDIYSLRGLCLIRENRFEDAIADYDRALKDNPSSQNLWFNRMLCRVELKDYEHAQLDLDTIISKWSDFSRAYSVKASVYLTQKDTTQAVIWLDKALEKDPYVADMWMVRANISMAHQNWKEVDEQLSKAIHLKPSMVPNYVNRALARLNTNNLRGAMEDYDRAIELDPENFLARYNRGLLRIQVGDDNRAIEDFDYVLKMEPNNLMATYNRAVLLHKTGDLRGAIRDYTSVINQYPNFWWGLINRAECYRRLGMNGQAELDEFKVFQAQMAKRVGVQPRWSREQLRQTRKKSEIDMSKYNQFVVEDEEVVEHDVEYDNIYRGKVQNRKVEVDYMPAYQLSYLGYANVIKSYQVFDEQLDAFNQKAHPQRALRLTCNPISMNELQSKEMFTLIDSLSIKINNSQDIQQTKNMLLERAVAYSAIQDYSDAIDDLNTCLGIDGNMALALWHRAVCQMMGGEAGVSQSKEAQIITAAAMDDLNQALTLMPGNPYILFDRGNLHVAKGELQEAIDDYTRAIEANSHVAEAYYNRGLARIKAGNRDEGIADLSKAGELGLYSAYSMIKKYAK